MIDRHSDLAVQRLALSSDRFRDRDQRPERVPASRCSRRRVDADERIAAFVAFDLDDVEPPRRARRPILAGEAAPGARVVAHFATLCAFNRASPRQRLTASIIDHQLHTHLRRGELTQHTAASSDLAPDIRITSRLCTSLATSARSSPSGARDLARGLRADWRVHQTSVDRRRPVQPLRNLRRGDLDAALSKFEELQPATPRPENAASQV